MWTFVTLIWNSLPRPNTHGVRIWKGKRRGCVRYWINLENVRIEKGGDESLVGNG